jgi:SP family general alpha glucoside:H+ symporter-like MFS transporter
VTPLQGSLFGLALNGWASERFGYKKTMIVSMAFMIATIFIPFFAPNIETLLAGAFLQGVPWGVFQTLTTAYASEIVPVPL